MHCLIVYKFPNPAVRQKCCHGHVLTPTGDLFFHAAHDLQETHQEMR